jgi:putative copper export protein
VFQFTEAVDPDSWDFEMSGKRGPIDLGLPTLEASGRVIRVVLLDDVAGVVTLSWQVASAIDGHESAGELAFAVGEGGSLPGQTSGGVVVTDAPWRLVFLAALTMTAAGLFASSDYSEVRWGAGRLLSQAGFVVSAIVAATLYLRGGSSLASPASVSVGSAGAFAALGALALRARRIVWPAIFWLASLAAWSVRGHVAGVGGVPGWLLATVHLAAALSWVAFLAVVVVRLWRRTSNPIGRNGLGRYIRMAWWLVLTAIGAGFISAFVTLTAVDDLWKTDYGRLLVFKLILIVIVLTGASVARWRALGNRRRGLLRRSTTMELVALVAVITTSAVLASTGAPAVATSDEALLGPPPIAGPAARGAGLAGNMTVGVQAGGGRLDILVYNESTGGIEDARIDASAVLPDGRFVELHPRSCGSGCFTQQLELPEGTSVVSVAATSDGWTDGVVDLEVTMPPAEYQPERLHEILSKMRAVPTLKLTETVNSGPGATATSHATLSGEEFIALEVYAAGDLDEVSLLNEEPGVRLYLPGSRILVDLELDETGRVKRERIVSPGHEITRTFTYP